MNEEEIEYTLKKSFPATQLEVCIDDHYLEKQLLYTSITIRTDLVKIIPHNRPGHQLTGSEYLEKRGQISDNRKAIELITKLLGAVIIPGLKPCIEKDPMIIVKTLDGIAI